jgi:hypothetical protein
MEGTSMNETYMRTLKFFAILICLASLGLMSGCAKSKTKFIVLGFELEIEDPKPSGES